MSTLLRLISLLCCAFVIVAFALFAIAQTSHASQGQANAVASGTITSQQAKNKPVSQEKQPRKLIDQVAEKLNSPWNGIISTNSQWVKRGVPTIISLLVYGFLLSFIARWAAGRPT
jgi:predicted PurR-regulated permease PerM